MNNKERRVSDFENKLINERKAQLLRLRPTSGNKNAIKRSLENRKYAVATGLGASQAQRNKMFDELKKKVKLIDNDTLKDIVIQAETIKSKTTNKNAIQLANKVQQEVLKVANTNNAVLQKQIVETNPTWVASLYNKLDSATVLAGLTAVAVTAAYAYT